MNRSARAHRSTKIPNVKLRPAHIESASALASSSKQHQNKLNRRRDQLLDDREDANHFRQLRDHGQDHGAHVDADFIGSSAHPLKGAVISITGLSDAKPALTQYARELGARVEGNLTEDVTHLIADRPGSQKYRFALDLGMHIVTPDWILQVRNAWLQGDDVDAEQLEQRHLLPPLTNTLVCFSALPAPQRRSLAELAHSLGATVSDELRFDGTVTHLVSATADPNASSSVRHLLHFLDRSRHGRNGTREQAAARILAVRPEWLTDCHSAQGCLSEQLYSVFAPLPDQQQRDKLVQKAQRKIPSPFNRDEKPLAQTIGSPFVASSRSRLNQARTASGLHNEADHHDQDDDDDEPITLGTRQRAAAAAEKSFDNILSQLKSNQPSSASASASASLAPRSAGTNYHSAHARAEPSASAAASATDAAPARPNPIASFSAAQSHSLLGMSRASSFSRAPPSSTNPSLHHRKAASKPAFLPRLSMSSTAATGSDRASRSGCFQGKTFRICLKDARRNKLLAQVLAQNGAKVLEDTPSALAHFAVVDPKQDAATLQALSDAGATPVLHFWIEYCLHHESFVEPAAYFAALPAQVPLPLADGHRLRLYLLGFDPESPELYHAQKLVAEMGGTIATQMRGENLTHAVCATLEGFEGRRAQRARSHGIPVVGLEFLIRAKKTGRLVPAPTAVVMADAASLATTSSSSSSSAATARRSTSLANQNSESSADADAGASLPLAGCTISRSKVLSSQTVMLERKALQLGACWQPQANESTTHLLHRGSAPARESKELGKGVFFVHPSWLDKCLEENIRVDESLFPSSMDPAKSLLTVLSNSDGSASGNFLSQATQSLAHQQRAQQPTQDSRQTQAMLVAAAKPWHRSISADAARHSNAAMLTSAEDSDPDGRRVRGRSEEIDVTHDDDEASGDNTALDLAAMDEDDTLGDATRGVDIEAEDGPAPSSQTLFEEHVDEASIDDAAVPHPNNKKIVSSLVEERKRLGPSLKDSGADQMASADKVVELLRTRALASGARRKMRPSPRTRKQRSEDTMAGRGSNEVLPPEQVLEAQAQLDAQRAAEAAAHGYSLGMDRDVAMLPNSQNGQSFDASVRIVYDDPAARRERTRLLKMLEHHQPAARGDSVGPDEQCADSVEASETEGEASEAVHGGSTVPRKRGTEDTFGAARHAKAYWETRNSESPTKRPVVRRQPLARR